MKVFPLLRIHGVFPCFQVHCFLFRPNVSFASLLNLSLVNALYSPFGGAVLRVNVEFDVDIGHGETGMTKVEALHCAVCSRIARKRWKDHSFLRKRRCGSPDSS